MHTLASLFRLWFGVTQRVGRRAYALSGFGLMLLKYGVEAGTIAILPARAFYPWDFFNPLLESRAAFLTGLPDWVGWAWFAWSLPFLWIALTMSVRRSADAGLSPWTGMFVLVPIVNLVYMLVMCCVPTSPSADWRTQRPPTSAERRRQTAIWGVTTGLLVGGAMLALSVYALETYGSALFLGTPLLMGATAAYVDNRDHPRSYFAAMSMGLATIGCACLGLLLFALEGLICIVMAMPLLVPIGALGGVLGKAIADSTRRPVSDLAAALLALPLLAGAEAHLAPTHEYVVLTTIEIDAPPEVVWRNVVGFPELPPPTEWYFRYGIACPQRARIEGAGVGAVRYCEFSTGAYVEPITVWDEPRRLAFDVTEQPAPMFELSPYRHIHPPHLDDYLRSKRGEFRLTALPNGRTRLEGRTWYEVAMYPQAYWTLWTDLLIHRIHVRVLRHIEQLSEAAPEGSQVASSLP